MGEDNSVEVTGVEPVVEENQAVETQAAESDKSTEPAAPETKPQADERTTAFRELRAHNKQLERALREQSEQLKALSSRIPEPQRTTVEQLVKPTLDMFGGDHSRYEEAMEYYAEAKTQLKREAAEREYSHKHAQETAQARGVDVEFQHKLTLAKQVLPDLDGALQRIQAENVGEGIDGSAVTGIKRSPVAAELFHFLESNRQYTADLEKLSAADQIAALKAVEQWIFRGGYKPTAKAPPAPAATSSVEPGTEPEAQPVRTPPRPRGGSGVTPTPSLAAARTPSEYLAAFREARQKGRKR